MKKTIRRWISLFLSALLALSFAAGAEEDPLAAGEANLADHGLTLDDVLSDYSGIQSLFLPLRCHGRRLRGPVHNPDVRKRNGPHTAGRL